jgi:hypothetical protein
MINLWQTRIAGEMEIMNDSIKTVLAGTGGIGVWWMDFMPDILKYITALLVIFHLLIKIRKDIK